MSALYTLGTRIYLDFTDQWGIRHRKSLKINLTRDGKFPREAFDIQKKIDAEIAYGSFDTRPSTPRIKISEMLDEYLSFIGNQRDQKTIYLYKLAIQSLLDYMRDVPINSITQEMMIEFRDWMIRKKSNAYASRTMRSLSPIFRFYAEQKRWIPSSPINRYTAVRVQKLKPIVFTEKELKLFFKWSKKNYPHFYKQAQFLYLTGFRSHESCTLKWNDIDLSRKELLHFDDKENAFIPYPLDIELTRLLKSLPHREDGFVFHYRDIHSLDHIMIKARKEIPLRKELKIHTLKKMYVRNLIDAQLPETEVHRLSHHKSISTTHHYYATFDLNRLRNSLSKSRKKISAGK